MKKLYRICGLPVECDFRFPVMTARAEKYLCDSGEPPAISIGYSEERMKSLKLAEPSLTADDCEIIYTAREFYFSLLRFGGFMLHASAVAMDGEGFLFSAPSGTGKSTHTGLWRERFGCRAQIINDDKPAIIVSGGEITVCGTPWSGKSDLNLNMRIPLRGICVLERSQTNFIEPLPPEKSVYCLLDQTIRPLDGELMGRLLELLDAVAAKIPLWRMGCNISPEAAEMAYKAMSGK